MPNRLSNSLRSMVSLDSSVSLPAETEVEYEPVTVTVTSPLPETTVLPSPSTTLPPAHMGLHVMGFHGRRPFLGLTPLNDGFPSGPCA